MRKAANIILLFVLLCLTACTSQPAATSAPAGGSTSCWQKVEITFSAWGAPEELAVWNQIVADFEAANPNVKVNVEVSDWTSYWDKLKTQLAANTPPDVFAMDAPLFLDYQTRGVLLNLQPYIDKNPDMLKEFILRPWKPTKPQMAIMVYRVISRPSSCSTTRICSMLLASLTRPPIGPGMTCALQPNN